MSAEQILINTKALIEDESHWCQYTFARASDGAKVPLSQTAAKFCVSGALSLAERIQLDYSQANRASYFLNRAAYDMFELDPVQVNDRRGHAAVMRMLDYAIELARKDNPDVLDADVESAEPKVLIEA